MLGVCYLGAWMARVYSDRRHLRARRPSTAWSGSTRTRTGLEGLRAQRHGLLPGQHRRLFALILVQLRLPLSQGSEGMGVTTALTAVSFVTNTNWQSYAGEIGATPIVQTVGLTVQNFVSAAVGIAVAVALTRASPGVPRTASATSGSTWSAAPCGSCCRSRPSALSC